MSIIVFLHDTRQVALRAVGRISSGLFNRHVGIIRHLLCRRYYSIIMDYYYPSIILCRNCRFNNLEAIGPTCRFNSLEAILPTCQFNSLQAILPTCRFNSHFVKDELEMFKGRMDNMDGRLKQLSGGKAAAGGFDIDTSVIVINLSQHDEENPAELCHDLFHYRDL